MRLAFWRSGKATAAPAHAEIAPLADRPLAAQAGELDFLAIGQALARKRNWIIVPTILAAVLSITAVNMIAPRYKSEVRILIDGRENVFLRPNGERNDDRTRSMRKPSPARCNSCCRAIS